MGKINCRGHENRVALCRQYKIIPEFRIKLVTKGIIISDSGGRITDELYIFSAYDQSEQFIDKIICGEPTAKDFLLITGAERPPLFNMLKSTSKPSKEKGDGVKKEKKPSETNNPPLYSKEDFSDWHPVNKALYDAIMILIIVFNDTTGDSVLFRQREKCIRYKNFYPYSDRLMAVNTIIGKDRRKTLSNILKSLEKAGNNLRDFDLELLHEAVIKTGVKSNIL